MKIDNILLEKGFKKIIDDSCYVLYKRDNDFIEIRKIDLRLRIYKSHRLNPIVLDKETTKAVHQKMQELGREQCM